MESYHTQREVDISDFPVALRKALYNTEGPVAIVLESSKATTKRAHDAWFECPVTRRWLPRREGIRISGTLYSPEAAEDLLEDRRRAAL